MKHILILLGVSVFTYMALVATTNKIKEKYHIMDLAPLAYAREHHDSFPPKKVNTIAPKMPTDKHGKVRNWKESDFPDDSLEYLRQSEQGPNKIGHVVWLDAHDTIYYRKDVHDTINTFLFVCDTGSLQYPRGIEGHLVFGIKVKKIRWYDVYDGTIKYRDTHYIGMDNKPLDSNLLILPQQY